MEDSSEALILSSTGLLEQTCLGDMSAEEVSGSISAPCSGDAGSSNMMIESRNDADRKVGTKEDRRC